MIRRLITHGCSFTYGQELADPGSSSWPALLARKLDIELLNLAQPGYSNDLILQEIVTENINPKVGTPRAWDYQDLVIIGWTSHLRMGFVDDQSWYTVRPGATEHIKHRSTINELLVKTTNTDWLYQRWIQQVILAQEYLRNRHAHFLMFSVFDNLFHDKKRHKLYEKVIPRHFVGWPREQMVDWTYGCPDGPEGHPLERGHAKTADKIYQALQELYGL